MASELNEALEELAIDVGEQIAEDLHEKVEENLETSYQGAPGLVEYLSDVEQRGDQFEFTIDHPTAPLHERGSHIEPTYAQAMSVGWTRDGFYEALEDCNEWVRRKGYTMNAMLQIRREWGDRR